MKSNAAFCLLAITMIACQSESVSPKGDKPLRVTYTYSNSGKLKATETYEYNKQGLVSKYVFTEGDNNTMDSWDREVQYDYASDGNLIEKREKFGNIPQFAKTEYKYNNGLKVLEEYYSHDGKYLSKAEFFYSTLTLPDSSVYAGQVEIFTYDNNNHLTKKVTKYLGDVIQTSTYTYDGNILVKACENRCFVKTYNESNQLVLESAEYDGGVMIKSAEYFYKDGLLDEKWSYLYATPGDASTNFDILKAKYEY